MFTSAQNQAKKLQKAGFIWVFCHLKICTHNVRFLWKVDLKSALSPNNFPFPAILVICKRFPVSAKKLCVS